MERFENAKIDDLVWCRKHGNGAIYAIGKSKCVYKIDVEFESKEGCQIIASYTIGGYYEQDDAEPMLFYRKGEERYLTERPEQEINWDKEEIGTDFNVSTDGFNWTINEFCGFIKNQPVFSYKNTPNKFRTWKYIRRIK